MIETKTKLLAALALTVTSAGAACSSSTGATGVDSGTPETSTPDASKPDSHVVVPDGGGPETSTADTGMPDAVVAETSTADTGSGDAVADAGSDAVADGLAADGGWPACSTAWLTPPTLAVDAGANLDVPLSDAGAALKVILHGHAVGTQDYTCEASDAGTYSWVFVGPEAMVNDCNGTFVIEHSVSAGGATRPQWASQIDTSIVVGAKLQSYTATATDIPWLLLQAVSSSGTGLLTTVQYVQRLNTSGGIAPTTTCDSTTSGTTTKVAYSAEYWFYAP